MVICPRSGIPVTYTGQHLILDFHGACNLTDVDYIKSVCEDASLATGATILGSNFHHFGGDYGVTGVILLSSSHMSVHTWPEYKMACLDIFVCDGDDPWLAIDVLKERFKPTKINYKFFQRGKLQTFKTRILSKLFRIIRVS